MNEKSRKEKKREDDKSIEEGKKKESRKRGESTGKGSPHHQSTFLGSHVKKHLKPRP